MRQALAMAGAAIAWVVLSVVGYWFVARPFTDDVDAVLVFVLWTAGGTFPVAGLVWSGIDPRLGAWAHEPVDNDSTELVGTGLGGLYRAGRE